MGNINHQNTSSVTSKKGPYLLYNTLINVVINVVYRGIAKENKLQNKELSIIRKKVFYKHQMLRKLSTAVPVEAKRNNEKQQQKSV